MRSLRLTAMPVVVLCLAAATLVAQAPTPAQTPGQVYLAYRAVYEKAKAMDEVLPFYEAAAKAKLQSIPKEQAKAMWEMMKGMDNYTAVTVLKETITGDTCTLDVQASKPDKTVIKGTVKMVKKGTWLLQEETWPM